ncbi:YgfZ/GcvT domain-containing protein [Candidatus Symbiobacter mobilis]|nr:hypothetical protein [Candidatus Symbiobacter mobilis]
MLTQDVLHRDANHACLAGWCSPQGRLLASVVLLRGTQVAVPNATPNATPGTTQNPVHDATQEAVFLVVAQDLVATTLQGLRKFVLRSRVILEDCSLHRPVWGLVGSAVAACAPQHAADDAAPWMRWRINGADVVRLPDAAGVARALWIGDSPATQPPAPASPDNEVNEPNALDEETWEWLAVHSGIAWITARTSNLFVPQMLGYDALGAIDFRKGCYPGQEVIARSQYRGKVQRRACLARCAVALHAGQEICADPETPCGTVVQAAASPGGDGGYDAIICIHADAPARIFATTTEGKPIALTLSPPFPAASSP